MVQSLIPLVWGETNKKEEIICIENNRHKHVCEMQVFNVNTLIVKRHGDQQLTSYLDEHSWSQRQSSTLLLQKTAQRGRGQKNEQVLFL